MSILSASLVGVVLVVAPWTTIWDSNYLLQPFPTLRQWLLDPFARGLVSGLGLVNMMIAFAEARDLFTGSR